MPWLATHANAMKDSRERSAKISTVGGTQDGVVCVDRVGKHVELLEKNLLGRRILSGLPVLLFCSCVVDFELTLELKASALIVHSSTQRNNTPHRTAGTHYVDLVFTHTIVHIYKLQFTILQKDMSVISHNIVPFPAFPFTFWSNAFAAGILALLPNIFFNSMFSCFNCEFCCFCQQQKSVCMHVWRK